MSRATKQPLVENGVVVGTTNKYQLKNPLARKFIQGFDHNIAQLVAGVKPRTILEIGAGEGHVTQILIDSTNATILATDLSVLAMARAAVRSPRVNFRQGSIYDLAAQNHRVDLIACCEVLEHLEDPERGLRSLAEVAAPYCLMTVPREPIWRALNFVRGAYFSEFGNSPGHLQHWSKRAFLKFVATEFDILAVASPLPWTMVLARSRRAGALDR